MVIDASVALKWFYVEEESNKAEKLYQKLLTERIPIVVPHLFIYELGNTLGRNSYTKMKISEAQKVIQALSITYFSIDVIHWSFVMKFMRIYQLSYYDASYVYLANKLNSVLTTADKKLYQKTKKLGFVKFL